MVDERLAYFLTQIYSTNGAEIDCRRLQALLPAYVDYNLAGGNGASGRSVDEDRLAGVQCHLSHCPDCNDVYEGLRQVVALTGVDELPDVESLLADFAEADEPAPSRSHGELVRCSN